MTAGSAAPIKVMVVDDSIFMRRAVERILTGAGDIAVCDAVATGELALEHLEAAHPDVITMDVEMPGMGGIAAVKAIMSRRRVPIVMLSAFTAEGTETTFRALENGAADFVAKPGGGPLEIAGIAGELIQKIRALARHTPSAAPVHSVAAQTHARPRPGAISCIAIGISTGGPAALSTLLARLPADLSVPILIVQHMPVGFTKPLAERLDLHCAIEVVEATDGMLLRPGRAIIGAAGKQMRIVRGRDAFAVSLEDDMHALYHPSVDVLMHSVAEQYGRGGLGIIMTGMGADGAEGLGALKARGGVIYAQDEQSSTVYGMPRAAVSAGLVDRVLSLNEIGDAVIEAARRA